MKHPKLRIVWSVVCGLACVLLIALWVRSYWRIDWLSHLNVNSYVNVASGRGCVGLWYDSPPPENISAVLPHGWQFNISEAPTGIAFGSRWNWRPSANIVWIPHGLLIAICAALGFAPWIQWTKGFSLRTLLIATTLVAAVLGLLVWLRR